jgi:hypothetical protein
MVVIYFYVRKDNSKDNVIKWNDSTIQ